MLWYVGRNMLSYCRCKSFEIQEGEKFCKTVVWNMLRLDTIGRNMQIQCYSTVNIQSSLGERYRKRCGVRIAWYPVLEHDGGRSKWGESRDVSMFLYNSRPTL